MLGNSYFLIILVFFIGYLAIVFESKIKINKTASAIFAATITWMIFFSSQEQELKSNIHLLEKSLTNASQIIFFLLGAMALVELIDSHKGFNIVTNFIETTSKKKMLWVIGITTFFLSSILDNLTTTIVMVSLLRKLIPEQRERWILGSLVVIAANAGGAWTPIGDVTTTMLWINGNVTSLALIKNLFIPSFVSLIVALLIIGRELKGHYPKKTERVGKEGTERGGRLVFFLGVGGLVFVPILKAVTGLPPFMGILVALSIVWIITDLLHNKDSEKQHLRIPHILTRIDISAILFFLGILLCISALEAVGLLHSLAEFFNTYIPSIPLIATLIGLISAVLDNVPLVAATMGMYSLEIYPVDSLMWMMIAYCAGTGGSILIIGSAAGVALMGMEKIDFLWYLRKISFVAFISYLSGIGTYLLQQMLCG